jgi:hypothetical protein
MSVPFHALRFGDVRQTEVVSRKASTPVAGKDALCRDRRATVPLPREGGASRERRDEQGIPVQTYRLL